MNTLINQGGNISFLAKHKTSLVLFLLSAAAFIFFFLGWKVLGDVYKIAVVGAIYELLWLPMMLVLIVAPVISILILFHKKSRKMYAIASLIIIAAAILMLVQP